MKKIDFLAIGDTVIDAFIQLKDAEVHCNINKEDCELCVRFGDKVPYEDVEVVPAVGNAANAAVSSARLGLNSSLMTYLGKDKNGQECLEIFKKEKVDTDYVTLEEGKKTNYHYVLSYDVDRTILIKHERFSYSFPKEMPEVGWIYFSSVSEDSIPYHREIANFVKNHPETKLAFQPSTLQIVFGLDKLKEVYENTYVFFCNKEEAERILKTENRDIKDLIKEIHNLGPKIVSISDGPNGAYASDGEKIWFIPMYPDIAPPLDRTGAGDAFSSAFTVALALGKSIPEALAWGPINSMNVVQHMGAQKGLLTREKLEEYLANAPEEYKAKEI